MTVIVVSYFKTRGGYVQGRGRWMVERRLLSLLTVIRRCRLSLKGCNLFKEALEVYCCMRLIKEGIQITRILFRFLIRFSRRAKKRVMRDCFLSFKRLLYRSL